MGRIGCLVIPRWRVGAFTAARISSIWRTHPVSDAAAIWKLVWSETRRCSAANSSAARRSFGNFPLMRCKNSFQSPRCQAGSTART